MTSPNPQQPTPIISPLNGGIAPGRHRIHLAFVFKNAFSIAVALFFIVLMSVVPRLIDAGTDAAPYQLSFVGVGVMLLFIVGYFILFYRRFSWELGLSEISVYSGILFKKQVHIPFTKVQSIDFRATVADRILGIVTLSIETAGGLTNKATLIPALKLNEAEALRAEVFNRRRAASATGLASAPAAAGPLVGQAALAGSASAVQRFDPQTGQPLPPPGVLATGGPTTVVVPRFDPQTGQPLPPPVSTADQVVAGLGDLSSGLRGIFAENYDENVPIEFEYTLRARELLLAAISSDTNISSILIMAVVLLQTAAMFIPMLISDDALSNAAIISNGNLIPLLVIGTLGFIVFIFALTVLGMAVNLGGFQGRRRGGRIEVEHGLLQRVYRGVGIPKVQTVVVKQGFIRRLIGYAELTIQTIDTAGASNNPQGNNVQSQVTRGLVLHPFIKLEQVDSLLSGLLPEFNGRPQPVDYQPLPRVALRRAINRRVLLPAPIVLIPLVGIPWLIFGLSWPQFSLSSASLVQSWLFGGLVAWSALWLLIWIIRVFGAVFWYRNARYAWNRDYLVLHQGAWSLTDTYIPRRKIQWGEYLQTPFQRWSEVATVQATTAAGLGHTSTALKDLPLLAAESYLDWLRPHGLEQSSRS